MRAVRMVPGKVLDTSAVVGDGLLIHPGMKPYQGIIRYGPHVGAAGRADITADEAKRIIDRGKGLALVQHVRRPYWHPRDHSGRDDALCLVSRAIAIGYPFGAHLWCDLEGIEENDASGETRDYSNEWADTIVAEGYRAGCYVGFAVPLSPLELYHLHRMTSYWSDAATRQVAVRGFALKQLAEIRIASIPFDPNIVSVDQKGETPFWAMA